jgi:DNA-binding transcriptional LysR family regulator
MSGMAKLDIDWLRVFVEVYRTQNVSRAAERLNIPQANASVALGKLRRHFGDPLFARTSRGMAPTPHAQAIYPDVLAAVEKLTHLAGTRAVFEPSATDRVFRIGMTDISEIVVLPALVNHLQTAAPRVRIEAERVSADSARRLESGEIDLAVGFMPQLQAGFYQRTLFKQDYVCLAAANHPRVKPNASKLTKQAFLAEGHLTVASAGTGTGHAIVEKVLAAKGLARRVVLEVPSFLGVARLVATTELLVIVPRRLGEALAEHEAVRMLEPPVPLPPYAVKQHWHERFHADPGHAWLRRVVAGLMTA